MYVIHVSFYKLGITCVIKYSTHTKCQRMAYRLIDRLWCCLIYCRRPRVHLTWLDLTLTWLEHVIITTHWCATTHIVWRELSRLSKYLVLKQKVDIVKRFIISTNHIFRHRLLLQMSSRQFGGHQLVIEDVFDDSYMYVVCSFNHDDGWCHYNALFHCLWILYITEKMSQSQITLKGIKKFDHKRGRDGILSIIFIFISHFLVNFLGND